MAISPKTEAGGFFRTYRTKTSNWAFCQRKSPAPRCQLCDTASGSLVAWLVAANSERSLYCVTETVGSPKQKEHKTPSSGASPPSQTSRDKVPSANAGSQAATWKDKVNPFKRHGSGSTLSSTDQTGTSSSAPAAVTGAFGVPLHLCQPGVANKVSTMSSWCK